jgi:signal transduction histidine kinase
VSGARGWTEALRLTITITAVVALALGAVAVALAVEAGPRRARMAEAPGGVEVLRDPGGALTFEEVRARERRGAFARLDPRRTNFCYASDTFWLAMTLRGVADRPTDAVIELSTTPERALLYVVGDDGRVAPPQESGTSLPFDRRPLAVTNVAFPITAPAGATLHLYLRVRSHDTMALDPLFWPRSTFEARQRSSMLLDGAYYGALLGLVLYNLFLFLGTADRNYLAYVIFELFLIIYQGIADKYAFQYLWPRRPEWGAWTGSVSAMAVAVAGLAFADRFLGLRAAMPRVHRGFQTLIVLGAALIALNLAGALAPHAIVPAFVLTAVVTATCASAALAIARDRKALLFLGAWSFLFAGTTLAALGTLGVLQASDWFRAIKIGSAMEATLMSLVLAHRIAALRRERERAQRELLALRTAEAEALESRVRERTRELAETVESLHETRAAFARQDRLATVGRMVAGVVHEVGNPLNFLRGGVAEIDRGLRELAGEREPSGPSRDALARSRRALDLVRGGCEQIDRIIQNLRGYVRRDPPPAEITDVVAVLRATLALLDGTLRDGSVELVTDWQPVPAVLFIPGQLGQVLTNLIVNACEAMPAGGRLSIGCHYKAGLVQIVLRDTGPGVPLRLRENIFEPFVSGRSGGDNAGLGLYVSHEIVTHNGGTLWLAQRREGTGEGATFGLSLPPAAAERADQAARALRASPTSA